MTPSARPPAGNIHDGGAGDRFYIPPSYHRGARGGPSPNDSSQRRNLTSTRSQSPEPEKRSFQATKNIPAMKKKETIPAKRVVKNVTIPSQSGRASAAAPNIPARGASAAAPAAAPAAPSPAPDARVQTQSINARGVTTGARVRSGNNKVPATIAKTHQTPAASSSPPIATSCLCGRRGVILEKCNLHHVKECRDCHPVPPPPPTDSNINTANKNNNNNNNNNNNRTTTAARPRRVIIEKCNLHKIQGGYYCGECTSTTSASTTRTGATTSTSKTSTTSTPTDDARPPKPERSDGSSGGDRTSDGIRVYKVTQVY